MSKFKRGDVVRLSKQGVAGTEEKLVHSFHEGSRTLTFDNGKMLCLDDGDWTVEHVTPAGYALEVKSAHYSVVEASLKPRDEFAFYRHDASPWEVFEDLTGTAKTLTFGRQTITFDMYGLVSLVQGPIAAS